MKTDVVELKWFQFGQKIMNLRNKHIHDQLTRLYHEQERSVIILQKRYGYTREQAVSELNKHYSKARLG
jgi:ABC-type phosphate transport system auxiliary subunit